LVVTATVVVLNRRRRRTRTGILTSPQRAGKRSICAVNTGTAGDVETGLTASSKKRSDSRGFLQLLKDSTVEVCRDGRALSLLVVLVLSLLAGSAAAVALSYAQKDYITALAKGDASSFSEAIRYSLVGLALALPAKCTEEFTTGALALVWRDALVGRLLSGLFLQAQLALAASTGPSSRSRC